MKTNGHTKKRRAPAKRSKPRKASPVSAQSAAQLATTLAKAASYLTFEDAVHALDDAAAELDQPGRDYSEQERGQALRRGAEFLRRLRAVRRKGATKT